LQWNLACDILMTLAIKCIYNLPYHLSLCFYTTWHYTKTEELCCIPLSSVTGCKKNRFRCVWSGSEPVVWLNHSRCSKWRPFVFIQFIFMTIFSSSVLLDTTFSRLVFFVTVTCPCSSTTKCHVNLFVYNNNNNNYTCMQLCLPLASSMMPRGIRSQVSVSLCFSSSVPCFSFV